MKLLAVALAAALCAAPAGGDAKPRRSHAQTAAFQRQHPCPSTGQRRGPCPGYVIDHVRPLCGGGPDRPDNMQWQTITDAKAKDRIERRACRRR